MICTFRSKSNDFYLFVQGANGYKAVLRIRIRMDPELFPLFPFSPFDLYIFGLKIVIFGLMIGIFGQKNKYCTYTVLYLFEIYIFFAYKYVYLV